MSPSDLWIKWFFDFYFLLRNQIVFIVLKFDTSISLSLSLICISVDWINFCVKYN